MRNRIWRLELEADTVRRLDPTIYARYAQKLFPYRDSTVDLARGEAEVRQALSATAAAAPTSAPGS